MRQVGSLPNEAHARRFAAYLVTREISAVVENDGDNWIIWVHAENDVAVARDDFTAFCSEPDHIRYDGVEQVAETIHREEQKRQEQVRKNVHHMQGKWRDTGGQRRRTVTNFLVVVAVAVTFLTSFGTPKGGTTQYKVLDTLQICGDADYTSGSRVDPLASVKKGQVWRLITPIFPHLGPIHLLFNLIWLYQLGGVVEARVGHRTLAWVVLASAVFSNLGQAVIPTLDLFPSEITGGSFGIGMSGVVYGVFGYLWLKSRLDRSSGFMLPQSTVLVLLGWLLVCMTPLIKDVANVAHVVGLLTGMAAGYLSATAKTA